MISPQTGLARNASPYLRKDDEGSDDVLARDGFGLELQREIAGLWSSHPTDALQSTL